MALSPEVDLQEHTEAVEGCYYKDPQHCFGPLWTCQTCEEDYCEGHWHETDKGRNVECVACERTRKEEEKAKADNPDILADLFPAPVTLKKRKLGSGNVQVNGRTFNFEQQSSHKWIGWFEDDHSVEYDAKTKAELLQEVS